jgi:hypothetical protein
MKISHVVERRRTRHPHPEASQGRVREGAVVGKVDWQHANVRSAWRHRRYHGLLRSDSPRTSLNYWLRVTEKKSDQVALPPDAGLGEDAFDLRTHGVFSHTDGIRDLLRCTKR